MTTCLGKNCSFGLPRVPSVNCCQFIYLVISLLVLSTGCGIWLYQFLIIAYRFTLLKWQLFIILWNWFKHGLHFTAIFNWAIQSRKHKCSLSWQEQWFWTGRFVFSVFHDIGMNFKRNKKKAKLKYKCSLQGKGCGKVWRPLQWYRWVSTIGVLLFWCFTTQSTLSMSCRAIQ